MRVAQHGADMKHDFADTSWINEMYDCVVITNPTIDPDERQKQLDAAFEEIFGKPMVRYEEDEWKICEALNAARNN